VADDPAPPEGGRRSSSVWSWLLTVPLIGVLVPMFYNHADPRLGGIPFFYWYQMLWIPISVVVTLLVYRATSDRATTARATTTPAATAPAEADGGER
jgi:hypothetical protein